MFVNQWHVAFAPSSLLMEVISGTSEQNHSFDEHFIDIHFNGILFVNKMMFKIKE